MHLDQEKRALRKLLREVPAPSDAVARRAGEALRRHLGEAEVYARARRIGLFAALPDEIPTRFVFEAARREGREVSLPRLLASGMLGFARVDAWDSLAPGRYGVLEAPPSAPPVEFADLDFVCVPGVAFDRHGGRLGRGGGHYDRLLGTGAELPYLCGVAYAARVVDRVPMGPLDRAVHAVVSEAGWVARGHDLAKRGERRR